MAINKLKGTLDYFGEDAKKYHLVISKCANVAERFGFQPMITPLIEQTELFSRGVGDSSDIVKKEMYTFKDKSDRSITLRPEGTAAITRSYVENKLYANPGLGKYYYYGPMFRNERPQAGRYRQFVQFGIETFGAENPYLDADIINMGYQMIKELGIKNIQIHINSIGSKIARDNYAKKLKEHFASHLDELCDDCKDRFERNPLRMLDCKVDHDCDVMKTAPSIRDYLTVEDQNYFQKVLETLDLYEVPYVIDDRLVRGLDYYTGCVFEYILEDVASPLYNIAIGAGGRYNGLSKEIGGPDVEAIGFALGVDRLMLLSQETIKNEIAYVTVITLGEENKKHGLSMVNYLRQGGVSAEIDYTSHNLKPQFKLAERANSSYIIIIGSTEVENNCFKIKDTINHLEFELSIDELKQYFNIKGVENYAYKK